MNPGGRTRTPVSAGRAFVALGSNLGDSRQIILEALGRLKELTDEPMARSSLWQTMPVDCPPGSAVFVNAVAGLVPRQGATPESLLAQLQSIEKDFGRKPKEVHNEPRPLDLDLLVFGDETRATARLRLPHPRAHERRFVLQPLSEIVPELILPGQSETVRQLLEKLPADPLMRRLDDSAKS